MTNDLANKLYKSGLCKAFIGAEAFTESTLKSMRKQTTPDDNVQAIEAFCSAGVVLEIGNVIGFPGETQGDFDIRKEFYHVLNKKYPGMFTLNSESFRLVPGSGTYNETEKFGIQTVAWEQSLIDLIPEAKDVVSKIPANIINTPNAETTFKWLTELRTQFTPSNEHSKIHSSTFARRRVHNLIGVHRCATNRAARAHRRPCLRRRICHPAALH